jgi:hypothetical protein
MKIIITEDQYGQLTEMIKLDIKVGDTLTGKGSVKLVHNDSFNGNDITI